MSLALYRKYRGTRLADIVGQDHITKILENALSKQLVSHAYLFTGPRGVGKTSVARILAYAINDLPYKTEHQHLDIIEIDAASNRRIDEIRDLRDKVHIAPSSARFKVYIIDEVHMLTREAFNALLKTLEEPPRHVVFILATTEAHKVPDTIASRAQRHVFRPIRVEDLIKRLRFIADKEAIRISDDALTLIAEHGDGSFRDSISLLDQISRGYQSAIDRKQVEDLLGLVPATQVNDLYETLCRGNVSALGQGIRSIIEGGISPVQLSSQLVSRIRQDLLANSGNATTRRFLPQLMERLLDVPSTANPRLKLEAALFEFNLACSPQPTPEHPPVLKTPKVAHPTKEPENKQAVAAKAEKPKTASFAASSASDWSWDNVLALIKKRNASLYAVLRQAAANIEDNGIELSFPFSFHQKRFEDQKNKQVVLRALSEVAGTEIAVHSVVEPQSRTKQEAETSHAAVDNKVTRDIIDLMGGGEEYNGEL